MSNPFLKVKATSFVIEHSDLLLELLEVASGNVKDMAPTIERIAQACESSGLEDQAEGFYDLAAAARTKGD